MATPPFSLDRALELAYAAKQAYENNSVIKDYYSHLGYGRCDVRAANGSQVVIASNEEQIHIVFRGTEATFGQWLRNMEVISTQDALGNVHGGFSRSLDEVWAELRMLLDVHGIIKKRAFLAGHSLGGAQALICAARMAVNDLHHGIECLYTFGQPRLASEKFRKAFDEHFKNRCFRFINQSDIVPRVPPGYEHAGTPKRITGEGTLEYSGPLEALFPPVEEEAGELLESDLSMLNHEQFELLRDYVDAVPEIAQARMNQPPDLMSEGIFDWATNHFMDAYIREITSLRDSS